MLTVRAKLRSSGWALIFGAMSLVALPATSADGPPPKVTLKSGHGLLSVSAVSSQATTLAVVPSALPALRSWMAAFVSGQQKTMIPLLNQKSLGPTTIAALRLPALSPAAVGAPIVVAITHPGASAAASPVPMTDADKQKFFARSFRLQIAGVPGLVDASELGAIEIRKKPESKAKEPGNIEIPNLVITVAESSAKAILDWFEDFVVRGNDGQDQEKTGTLEYLTADGTLLLTLKLDGLRPISVTPVKPVEPEADTSGSDKKSKPKQAKKPAKKRVKIVLAPKKLAI